MKYTYQIEQDEYPPNPRDEFDNLSTFYGVRNNHFMTGGKHDVEFECREDLEEKIKALRKAGAVIVEFSHRCGPQYAVVERSQLKPEYMDFGYSYRKARNSARKCAKDEIYKWEAWADGEVYGFVVEDEDGNEVKSCWGFYGDDGEEEAEREAKFIIARKIETTRSRML